jgi:hypothetical protein
MAIAIAEELAEFNKVAKQVEGEYPVAAYWIKLHALMQAVGKTKEGGKKKDYELVKKDCLGRIKKLEGEKHALGDVKQKKY